MVRAWTLASLATAALLVAVVAAYLLSSAPAPESLTTGWTQRSFTYTMQQPWRLDLSERYRNDAATNTHTMVVDATDDPHVPGSATDPRTEMRWQQEYSSGQHMWEADVYLPAGSDGATILQIARRNPRAGTPATDGGAAGGYSGTAVERPPAVGWLEGASRLPSGQIGARGLRL